MNPRFMVVGILAILLLSAFAAGTEGVSMHKNSMENRTAGDFGKIVEIDGVRYTTHDVIRINSDADFGNQAAAEGWPGDGTQSNPYIISGYDIDAHGAGDAIYIRNTTVYFVVENCYLHNASYHSYPYFVGNGITLYNVSTGKIDNNTCSNNWNGGIGIYSSSSNIILNNTCNNDWIGIGIYSSSSNIILNNTCNNDWIGIGIYSSSSNNKLYENKIVSSGLVLWGDKNTFTTQEIPTNNTVDGKPVYYYKNANMNNASVPSDAGQVILGNVTWLKIENLHISANIAIEIGYSTHITVRNNTCSNNNYYGIYLDSSSNNTISNNTCSNNGYGINLDSSSTNTIANNSIYNNTWGIRLSSSSSNTIKNNSIYNNSGYGIGIYSGSHNHIYDNFFYYNHGSGDTYNSSYVQAYDDGSNNSWNSTTGIGNYWYDWANNNDTNDQNHDGIVDWPYKIAGSSGAKDYYPLKNKSLSNVLSHPMNLTAKVGNGYVNLTWEPPVYGRSTVTQYNIYRDGVLIKIKTVSGNQLWYNDTSVTNGQTYTYYVTAVNSVGESDKSNEVQATPGSAVPEMQVFWLPIIALILLAGILRRQRKRV